MSTAQTVALGAIAGFTIFLGLPVGRMRSENVRLKTFLTGISAGILVFLLFDILEHATVPVEDAINAIRDSHHGYGHLAAVGLVYSGGLAAGNIRASWKWLGVAGLIGGGPTFLGTLLGTTVSSDLVFVGFLALAAGAILYVIGELFASGRRLTWDWMLWGILAGFLIGLA